MGERPSPFARKKPAGERPSPFGEKRPGADRERSPFAKKAPGPGRERSPFAKKAPGPGRERSPFAKKSPGPGRERSPFAKKSPGAESSPFAKKAATPRPGDRRPAGDRQQAERPPANPPRPEIRPMSAEPIVFPSPAPARIGDWLYTTRPDAELDLLEEIALADAKAVKPRIAGPSLIASPDKPKRELAFARQGFPVSAIVPLDHPSAIDRLADGILEGLPLAQGRAARARGPQHFALDAWVPDHDRTNPDSGVATDLAERVRASIRRRSSPWAKLFVDDAREALAENGMYAQICVLQGQAYLGMLAARDAPSTAPGGRLRVHLPEHAPSRAAAKLLEAFAWLDRAPAAGEMCVDLGAAPGGWSWVLLERGAHVLAVDPAKLDPLVMKKRGLTHLRDDAFRFEPDEPIDWLVADMAWRPLEAAALYGKWARRRWARHLIANIKLPMKKKAEYLLRVRDILESSGWTNLRVRQLYHDREEVTVAAVRL